MLISSFSAIVYTLYERGESAEKTPEKFIRDTINNLCVSLAVKIHSEYCLYIFRKVDYNKGKQKRRCDHAKNDYSAY